MPIVGIWRRETFGRRNQDQYEGFLMQTTQAGPSTRTMLRLHTFGPLHLEWVDQE